MWSLLKEKELRLDLAQGKGASPFRVIHRRLLRTQPCILHRRRPLCRKQNFSLWASHQRKRRWQQRSRREQPKRTRGAEKHQQSYHRRRCPKWAPLSMVSPSNFSSPLQCWHSSSLLQKWRTPTGNGGFLSLGLLQKFSKVALSQALSTLELYVILLSCIRIGRQYYGVLTGRRWVGQ